MRSYAALYVDQETIAICVVHYEDRIWAEKKEPTCPDAISDLLAHCAPRLVRVGMETGPSCGLAVERAGGAAGALHLHRCASRERRLEEASRQDGPERLCRPCPNRAHRLNQAGAHQEPHQLPDSFAAHGARVAGAHSRQDRERTARASAGLRRAVRQTPRRLADSMAKPNHTSCQHRPRDVLSVFDLATIMVSHVRNVLPGAFRSF